jgi:hypothetical protein
MLALVPDVRRIGVLLLTQATRPDTIEDSLLREDIVDYRPAPSSTPHENSTNIADLRSGARGFHKPLAGVKTKLAEQYGHDQLSVGLNECAAWRLARLLGTPFTDMVPTTVLRFQVADASTRLIHLDIVDGWGSLSREQPGKSLDQTPLDIPEVNDPAAFFDALIAQQDRHVAQYRWDADARRLGLIDHGFAFARPGDILNKSIFLDQRHAQGRGTLTQPEHRALSEIARSPQLAGLRQILQEHQADALAQRIERMRNSGNLIRSGDW